jgi:hypothetical protein
MKIHLRVIRSADCLACRGCCTFDARYVDYAPLFTDEQRRRVLSDFPDEEIRFEPAGRLWRIVLREMPGTGRCVCPLLHREAWRCRVYEYGIFDCDTWPYQIQVRGGRRLLTLTPECPAVSEERMAALRARGLELLPQMLEAIERYPERLIPDYEGVIVLADLGPA